MILADQIKELESRREKYIDRFLAMGHGDVEQYAQVKQPAYIDGNVYLKGANAFDREQNFEISDFDPDVRIVDEDGKVFLEITLPEELFEVRTKVITSEDLGMTRISEACFENPDGSALTLDHDLTGAVRGKNPNPGSLEGVCAGRNRIEVWRGIRR